MYCLFAHYLCFVKAHSMLSLVLISFSIFPAGTQGKGKGFSCPVHYVYS